jgi:hypothetical protein
MHVAHITNQEHVIKKKSLDLINHWHILQCNVQKRSKEIGCHVVAIFKNPQPAFSLQNHCLDSDRPAFQGSSTVRFAQRSRKTTSCVGR